jgi:DNA polymerase-3 subunit epsilon
MKTNEEMIADRDQAIKSAREILASPYVVIDTETTGLNNAQMCQIAILHSGGKQFKSLVKPTVPIESGAEAVHHITNDIVKDAPSANELFDEIHTDKNVVIYNAPFDTVVIKHSMDIQNYPLSNNLIFDAMQIYSKFRGEWNDYYNNYRWHKLEVACNQCGIIIDLELHDALSDCIMTDRLIHYIAEQKLSTEV